MSTYILHSLRVFIIPIVFLFAIFWLLTILELIRNDGLDRTRLRAIRAAPLSCRMQQPDIRQNKQMVFFKQRAETYK